MKIGSALRSVTAAALASAALAGSGVTVDITKVQQRYPWNGLVDIDYTLTLADGETLSPADDTVEFTVTENLRDSEAAKLDDAHWTMNHTKAA